MVAANTTNTILVTGSGGCIGVWVVAELLKQGYQVIATDLDPKLSRLDLLMQRQDFANLHIRALDISDAATVLRFFEQHAIDAVIHLAALQVPFCKADPSLGARVNVVGTINMLEAVRQQGIKRFAYASSVAASTMPGSAQHQTQWLETLYGAYKVCNEQTAAVYWQDWQVPSVGIRPSVVYGVARDQGMSALPTLALLAACLDKPYTIPFSGDVGFVYVANIAHAFMQSISHEQSGATVHDYNGVCCSVQRFVELASHYVDTSKITISGDPLPFPAHMSNQPLLDVIGSFPELDLSQGIAQTITLFQRLIEQRKIDASVIQC